MPGALQVVVVYNKTNVFGLSNDAQILSDILPVVGRLTENRIGLVKLVDVREPPSVCDICIHLEVPYAVWFPWAKTNVIIVNSEWWLHDKWNSYTDSFDVAVFRDKVSMEKCINTPGFSPRNTLLIPWCTSVTEKNGKNETVKDPKTGFVWFIGGSPNKRAAAEKIIPYWKATYPPLLVTSVEPITVEKHTENVSFKTGFLDQKEKLKIAQNYAGHICFSQAESFGYTAAEAEQLGAYTLLNTLPCYTEMFSSSSGIGWLKTEINSSGLAEFTDLDSQLETLVAEFQKTNISSIAEKKLLEFNNRKKQFLDSLGEMIKLCVDSIENQTREPVPKHMPPLLNPSDCPPITVVTLTYNRPKFIENACLNLLSSDYPRDKIEWIVVDDSEPTESPCNRIIQFAEKFAPGKVSYVPLTKKHSIGYKRNLAVEKAMNDIIVMMDDDDHYPTTSFRRRVAYLLKARKRYECAACTTIAMYSLTKGISAVNVPPYTLSLGERCSEASLVFTKNFWNKRKFEEVDLAEADCFIRGRESQVAEIPPQQIIVALNHGKNISSRKIPDGPPNCFWGFPLPLLEFLHGLVGVKIDAKT
jgi:glycosyltransferase involved in cell wall biosynthesis